MVIDKCDTQERERKGNDMSEIPGTHDEFAEWWEKYTREAPDVLFALGVRAKCSLWVIENNPPEVVAALKEANDADIAAFTEAYRVWRAGNGS